MPRLTIKLCSGTQGWLDIEIQPILLEPDDPDYGVADGVKATVSIYPGSDDDVVSTTFDTKSWQVGKVYFETLANSFTRIKEFIHVVFPVTYYEQPLPSLHPNCTLHLDLDYVHILLRGHSKKEFVILDCFLKDQVASVFAHLVGRCDIGEAETFGYQLSDDLRCIREYDE